MAYTLLKEAEEYSTLIEAIDGARWVDDVLNEGIFNDFLSNLKIMVAARGKKGAINDQYFGNIYKVQHDKFVEHYKKLPPRLKPHFDKYLDRFEIKMTAVNLSREGHLGKAIILAILNLCAWFFNNTAENLLVGAISFFTGGLATLLEAIFNTKDSIALLQVVLKTANQLSGAFKAANKKREQSQT